MEKSSYCWVSGSRGFVGSAFAAELLRRKLPSTFITNTEPSDGLAHVKFGCSSSVEKSLEKYGVPDIYFHIGWGNVYQPDSETHLGDNLEQTARLFETLYKNGVGKIISLGSSSEYGELEGELSEWQQPIGRLTKYAQAKIESSKLGFSLAKTYNSNFIHVRLFHVLGISSRSNSLINQLYRAYKQSTVLKLTNCDQYRDYIWIEDVVEALLRLTSVEHSGIINLGSGRSRQLRDFIELFWSKLAAGDNLLQFGALGRPEDEPAQPRCSASLEKLREWLRWVPPTLLDDALSKMVADLKR